MPLANSHTAETHSAETERRRESFASFALYTPVNAVFGAADHDMPYHCRVFRSQRQYEHTKKKQEYSALHMEQSWHGLFLVFGRLATILTYSHSPIQRAQSCECVWCCSGPRLKKIEFVRAPHSALALPTIIWRASCILSFCSRIAFRLHDDAADR